jgi:hypothetical protein
MPTPAVGAALVDRDEFLPKLFLGNKKVRGVSSRLYAKPPPRPIVLVSPMPRSVRGSTRSQQSLSPMKSTLSKREHAKRKKKKGVARRDEYWSTNPADPKYWKGYVRRYFCDDYENLIFPHGHTGEFIKDHLPQIKCPPTKGGSTPYLHVPTY